MNKDSKLEELKSWRLVKVSYWLLACLSLIYTLTQSITVATIILALAYPAYWVIRRIYMYIQGIKYPQEQLSVKRKTALKEVTTVLLLLLGALLIIGFIESRNT